MSIDVDVTDGIATITINRPERMNAMDAEHYKGLSQAWMRVRDDDRDPCRDHHRRRREIVQRRRGPQKLHHVAGRARRDVADAARSVAQSRARSVEARHRGGERLLPRRRHDAAARHRHPDRGRARDIQHRGGEARHPAGKRRHAAHPRPAPLCDRHGTAAHRRLDRRAEGAALRPDQQGGAEGRS